MAGGKNKRSAPTVPWWLVWLGGILAAIVGILSSLDKIQDYLCRHGLTAACSNRFVLVLSTWPADIAGGWIADISNPTAYQATISDARLVFKRPSPQMPIAMTVIPAPKDWKSAQACNAPEPAIPPVSLGPQTATQLRLFCMPPAYGVETSG
jgi:hypothetical protein